MAEIRFCTAPDGARLAYAMHGRGPPLVRVATWLTHLELDWGSPVWRHWLDRLGECHTVLRYDERGCGLSDAEVERHLRQILAGYSRHYNEHRPHQPREQRPPLHEPGQTINVTAAIERRQVVHGLISEYRRAA